MANVLPNPDIPREQCIDKCSGCEKMFSDENIGDVCIAYINPSVIHRIGGCTLQTNREIRIVNKKKINSIKASKRARRDG